jgi:hypothetical protein
VQDINRQLIDILRDRRDVYVRICEAQSIEEVGAEWLANNPAAPGQMVDGVLGVFVEGLEGQSNEVRSFYLETLIPSLLENEGSPADSLVAQTVHFIMLMVYDAIEQVPAERRAAAADLLIRFSSRYLAEVAKVALGAKASRP